MKIHELLVENEQLDEGPLSAIGSGLGKVAGGAAKAVGAVAGGVAGLGSAFKKGYQSGKKTVAGDEEEPAADAPAEPAAGEAPAAGSAPAPAAQPKSAFGRLNTAANSGTKAASGASAAPAPAAGAASSPAMGAMANQLGGEKPNTMANAPVSKTNTAKPGNPNAAAPAEPAAAPTAKPAAAPAAPAAAEPAAANPKADSAYAQVQKAVQGLAPEQKSELVTMLKADPKVSAAMKQKAPAAAPAKAGSFNNQLAGGKQTVSTGAKFDPATMKNTPGTPVGDKVQGGVPNTTNQTAPAPAAKPAAKPAAAPTAKPAAADAGDEGKPGFLQSKLKGRKSPAGPNQAEIDADRERMMGKFTDSVERHKRQMTESAVRNGELSFFRKH